MPLYSRYKRKTYTPAPVGSHLAVLCDVVDLGMKSTEWGASRKIRFRYQLELINPETGRRFEVVESFTDSLWKGNGPGKVARLRERTESLLGRELAKREEQEFDLERLLGRCAILSIIHKKTEDGKVWANVSSVTPPLAKMPLITVEDYVREKDRPGYEPPAYPDVEKSSIPEDPDPELAATDEEQIPF
jgi:hypothetical protein